jgi:uncharacterized membrane protein
MTDVVQLVLRFLHVGSAIAWIGGATLWSLVIAPTLAQLAPTLPKGAVPTLGGKVLKVLPRAGDLTLLFGLAEFAYIENGTTATFRYIMLVALVLTILAVGVSHGVIVPTFKKFMAAASAPGPPGPETKGLMDRLMRASMALLGLTWVTVALMVAATSLHLGF